MPVGNLTNETTTSFKKRLSFAGSAMSPFKQGHSQNHIT